MRTCGTPCHKNSFLHKIYMALCATTLNIVTVACSFHQGYLYFFTRASLITPLQFSPKAKS